MFREAEFPPVFNPDYAGGEGDKIMEKRESHFEGSKDELVGNLQAGLMEAKDFVGEVLAREGGDPKRVDMATHSIKEFWMKQLDEGRLTPEQFQKGVYDAAVKMLKTKEMSAEEQEREKIRQGRINRAMGKRAA